MKKLFSLILVLCLLVGISTSASAAETFVNSASYAISGNSQSGKYATMALWTAADQYKNFDTTNCATHVSGTATVYVYEKTETVTYTATGSLTSNYATAFSSLANTLGVAYSATATVNLGKPFTIASTYASGDYCFRAKFTCYKVIEEVVTSTSSGNTVNWTKTITSAPKNTNGVVVAYKT